MIHGSYRVRDAVASDLPAILSINAEGVPGVSALAPRDAAALLVAATLLRVAEQGDEAVAYVIVFASHTSHDIPRSPEIPTGMSGPPPSP